MGWLVSSKIKHVADMGQVWEKLDQEKLLKYFFGGAKKIPDLVRIWEFSVSC